MDILAPQRLAKILTTAQLWSLDVPPKYTKRAAFSIITANLRCQALITYLFIVKNVKQWYVRFFFPSEMK